MNPALNMSEAIARMQRRSKTSIQWTTLGLTVRWRYIPATAVRNWDGSPAGSGNDPNQQVLERMTWQDGGVPRFSNYW